ncbi:hypothetical protein WG66_004298 [Moniliophthora roreri]|nr:hypothetical protein WG66_004298 [Moniliophthora roreri]
MSITLHSQPSSTCFPFRNHCQNASEEIYSPSNWPRTYWSRLVPQWPTFQAFQWEQPVNGSIISAVQCGVLNARFSYLRTTPKKQRNINLQCNLRYESFIPGI